MNGFLGRVFSGRKREVALARTWQARVADATARRLTADEAAFANTLRCEPTSDRVVIGRAGRSDEDSFWIGLTVQDLLGQHLWASGATGAGKTMACLVWLLQVLAEPRVPAIILDLKGELSSLLIDVFLPVITQSSGPRKFDRVRVVRPFDPDYVPLLRLTEPEPGVERAVQAHLIASALDEALGAESGLRMLRILSMGTAAAIEFNEHLLSLVRWFSNPREFVRVASRSRDPLLREYARGPFLREQKASLDAVLARLGLFFAFASVRDALSTPTCFSLPEALEGGITVVDLGNPPAGAERVSRFFAGVLVGRLIRAILSRPVTERSPQTLVLLEEWQEALGSHQAEQFNRLLALSRYKKVSCWFTNQQSSQLGTIDPGLLKSVRTNCAIQAQFRSNLEDARAFAHAIPAKKGRTREDLAADLTRLPDREFMLWLRRFPFGAQRVRSPRFDLAAYRALAAALPEETRRRIRQGAVAMPRADLPKDPTQDVGERGEDLPAFLVQRDGRDRSDPGIG